MRDLLVRRIHNGKSTGIQFAEEGDVLIARSWAWSDSDGQGKDYQSTLGRRRIGTLVLGLDTDLLLRGYKRASKRYQRAGKSCCDSFSWLYRASSVLDTIRANKSR